jgi:lauroyl/myristoyl acyltransferase
MYQLSQVLGTIWYRMNRGAVRRVRHHLQYLFGYGQADATLESLVRNQLVLSTWNAMIINLLPSLRDEHLASLLQVQGLHYIDENRRQGGALVLLGAHYGAYGYAVAACLSAHGHSIWLVGYGDSHSPRPGTSRLYRKLYWPRVQRLTQRIKTITINPAQEWQSRLRPVLEQKDGIVYLLPDQYFVVPPGQDRPAHLVPLRFLGHTVYLDIQGVQLVKEMGAQPLMAIPVRDGYRQRILIEPIEWASAGLASTDIVNDLQIYLTRLEQHLVKYPALWRDLRRVDLLPRMGVFESQTANG